MTFFTAYPGFSATAASSSWWEDPPLPVPAWSTHDFRFPFPIQMPPSASTPLYSGSAATSGDSRQDSHQSSALPFPGTSTNNAAVPALPVASGSWMSAYSAGGLGMLDDGSRAAMIWPPMPSSTTQPHTSAHSPAGNGYSSPGSTSRRARIQKVHHSGTAADIAQQQRSYHSPTRYPEEARSSSVLGASSEEEKPEVDNDPEYVDKDYSSGDAEYTEPAPPSTSTTTRTAATQSVTRGKKRKSADSFGTSGRSSGQAKVFQCTGFGECNMVFSRSEHLARHIRKHTGERPFKCRCGRAFSRLDNLRQHTQTVHHDQPKKNAEMLERLASVHANLSASASKVHKGINVPLSVARNAHGSSSSKSSSGSGSSSVSSEGTVKRKAAQNAEAMLDEMTVEEEIAHAMASRAQQPALPKNLYYPASHYTHRGSASSESTTSDFSISPSTPATRLPWLPHPGPHEVYQYRSQQHHPEAGLPRYVVSMSAPPPASLSREKEAYNTLPPIRPIRPLLPPLGALLPAPTDRLYPASFPPTTYPISPYFANASQVAWRAGLSYATAANTYVHSRPIEYPAAPGMSYDYRDYIVNQEEESSNGTALNGQYRVAPTMREIPSQDHNLARSASFDDSPPSFEGAQRATSSEESFDAPQEDVTEHAALLHMRTTTVTQENVTEGRLPKNATVNDSAAGSPYHWHMPLVSGLEYFAGHSRAISAERSTTTPLIPQVGPTDEDTKPAQIAEKMSLKTLCGPDDQVASGLVAEDAIFDEKNFHMSITD